MTSAGRGGGDTVMLPRGIRAEQPVPEGGRPYPAWFAGGVQTGTAALSTAVALRLRGPLDGPALEGALRALAARFTPGGTVVRLDLGNARQVAGAALAQALEDAAHEPFDLARGPLLRVGLYRQDAGDAVVLVVAHRVVTDACPMTALIGDLELRYHERVRERAGAPAAGPGVTCGESVRLYRWASASRRPGPRRIGR